MKSAATIKVIFIIELFLVAGTIVLTYVSRNSSGNEGYGGEAALMLFFWPLLIVNFALTIIYLFQTLHADGNIDTRAVVAGLGPVLAAIVYSLLAFG